MAAQARPGLLVVCFRLGYWTGVADLVGAYIHWYTEFWRVRLVAIGISEDRFMNRGHIIADRDKQRGSWRSALVQRSISKMHCNIS
jgi:hypothetical protein